MVGESGRWGRGRRICLSVTDFHVEVRSVLERGGYVFYYAALEELRRF